MNEFGTFIDMRDGYVYKTVRIGEQTWLAENLRFDCAGSFVYDNKAENLRKYGRLYTWRTAMNIAPDGWRLPSKKDWDELASRVGKDAGSFRLRAIEGWNRDKNGTDEFGFGALPGGHGTSAGGFSIAGDFGFWWSSSEKDVDHAFNMRMYGGMDWMERERSWNRKSFQFSVRLLRS